MVALKFCVNILKNDDLNWIKTEMIYKRLLVYIFGSSNCEQSSIYKHRGSSKRPQQVSKSSHLNLLYIWRIPFMYNFLHNFVQTPISR